MKGTNPVCLLPYCEKHKVVELWSPEKNGIRRRGDRSHTDRVNVREGNA
jgi:hypothetical protein